METSKNLTLYSRINRYFNLLSAWVIKFTGSPLAFILALSIIIVWVLTGPIFNYSDTWQLVINTGTTIITFLMVFLIQQSQNKDTMAIQLKLNELIASNKKASNRLIDIEDLTDEELATLKKFYVKLAELSKDENELHTSHSIDEAKAKHKEKQKDKLD